MTKERSIRVTYRATFEQPIGVLNSLNAKLRGPIGVEIRDTPLGWIACKPGDRSKDGLFPITAQPSADASKSQMFLYFKKQLSPWEVWNANGIVKKMEPGEYRVRDGKVYISEEK